MRMRWLGIALVVFSLAVSARAEGEQHGQKRILVLITEQNIAGPQRAWWASEVDLSAVEGALAGALLERNYAVVEPGEAMETLKAERAFRVIRVSDNSAAQFGRKVDADYILRGKAVASQGGGVPQSQLISYYATVTAKLIRVSDGKVLAGVSARGTSAHTDAITGGAEALEKAGRELASKIADMLDKQGAKR